MVVGFGYASLDLFTIDAMTAMLKSPLHFLSYLNQRARYADQLLASLAPPRSRHFRIAVAVRRTGRGPPAPQRRTAS
jgi:hypothetical protein